MFGDMPSDYCDHETFRMKIREGDVYCECGVSNGLSVFLTRYLIKQDDRIRKLEEALANFLQ